MTLRYWWLGLIVALVMIAVVVWRLLRPTGGTGLRGAAPAAHTDRVKTLPRYRHLVTTQLRWLTVRAACLVLACLGTVVLVCRPAWVSANSQDMRDRDVMLCLDVSGSMGPTDAAVTASYQQLISRLHGERIGFTVFDSSAATVFPLTDDYAFISEQLQQTLSAFQNQTDRPVIAATRVGQTRGSSLIADGLASCAQGFDHAGQNRSRTIVLATDNELSGSPLLSLKEATDQVLRRGIMVAAIMPPGSDAVHHADLEAQVERTGGTVQTLTATETVTSISRTIEASQRRSLLARPGSRSFDRPWLGASLILLGLLGMAASAGRLRG